MRIAKLEPSQHKQGRWLVWLEDGSLLRVGEGDVVSLSLYTGKELSEEDGAALTAAAGHSRLNERAVELLSARAMSRKELVDKLSTPIRRKKKKGEEETGPDPELLERQRGMLREQAEKVAARMEDLGLLNDVEYAAAIVRHYRAKGYGVGKLRDELYRRGVPTRLWDEALAQPYEGDSSLDRLVERRLRGAELTRESLKKTADYLARRGFGWEEISQALDRYRTQAGGTDFNEEELP